MRAVLQTQIALTVNRCISCSPLPIIDVFQFSFGITSLMHCLKLCFQFQRHVHHRAHNVSAFVISGAECSRSQDYPQEEGVRKRVSVAEQTRGCVKAR